MLNCKKLSLVVEAKLVNYQMSLTKFVNRQSDAAFKVGHKYSKLTPGVLLFY